MLVNLQRGEAKSVFEVTIKGATQRDAGVYICSASNAEGTVRQQFNLTIQGIYRFMLLACGRYKI